MRSKTGLCVRLWVVVCAVSCLPACRGLLDEPPEDSPSESTSEVRPYENWQKVLTYTGVSTTTLAPTHSGYLNHSFTQKNRDGIFYVHDLDLRLVGFVTPNGKAYVYDDTRRGPESRLLGEFTFERSVGKILGLSDVRIVLRPFDSE